VRPAAPYGRAVPQDPWLDFHLRTGIPVVIDGGASFEALSAAPSHYLGDIPVTLSYHATKSFATAEGGCIITTAPHLSPRVNQALNFGFFSTRDCDVASTNGKMSEYHAAVGLAELDDWSAKHAALRELAGNYRRLLDAICPGGRAFTAPDVAGCYALFQCADPDEASSVLRTFEESNIESRLWYGHGLHRQPYYADVSHDSLPVTERIAPLTIALPVAPDLSGASVQRVVAAIKKGVSGRLK
jgi:dTDP-4-amino-4,6-dideoxygalactose transaminase